MQTFNASTGARVKDLAAGQDPSWNPKASTIAYTAPDGLRTIPSAGGTSKLLLRSTNVSYPDYSPDGTKIAYVQAPTGGTGRIAYITLSTGKVTVTPVSSAGRFVWSPDGKDFAVTSATTGTATIITTGGTIVSRPGGGEPLSWEIKH